MIQLTKQNGSDMLYQTIYTEGRTIVQHQGIVQFSYEKGQEEAALERRHMMEEVIHDGLLHIGNGYCEGGDIGSGTTNIIYHVLDVEAAVSLIFEEIKARDVQDEPKIAVQEGETYTVLYPEGATFELLVRGNHGAGFR